MTDAQEQLLPPDWWINVLVVRASYLGGRLACHISDQWIPTKQITHKNVTADLCDIAELSKLTKFSTNYCHQNKWQI